MAKQQQPRRRSLTARITAEQELDRRLEEDAEFSRPREPLFSQAGPSSLALHQGKMAAWQKAKELERRKRRLNLDRKLRTNPLVDALLE